jgi:hypothetical protein
MTLRGRLGALAERNYRLLFSSTTVSALGDGVATIAFAFAVLQISDSPAALGALIAARQVASAGITVAAGVWADRLPRHLVLVAAATVQGAVQAATLLLRLSIAPRADSVAPRPFLHELREGWYEFRRQTWIWTTIVFFGIGNFAGASLFVLGPVVAKRDLGGAAAWASIVSAAGAGSIVGGLAALRLRPRCPLLASCVAAIPYGTQTLALGLGLPLPSLIAVAAVAGASLAVHLALWFTVFQQQVPEHARSRVSSYDALGSFVLMPLGAAIAGPVASVVGVGTTLIASGTISLICIAIVIAQPSVWAVGREPPPV